MMFLIYKENHLILVKMKKETWKYFLLKKSKRNFEPTKERFFYRNKIKIKSKLSIRANMTQIFIIYLIIILIKTSIKLILIRQVCKHVGLMLIRLFQKKKERKCTFLTILERFQCVKYQKMAIYPFQHFYYLDLSYNQLVSFESYRFTNFKILKIFIAK